MSSYDNASINEYANVVLPVSTYFETSGSAVNNEGIWQNFNSVIEPFADSRPAWKVLRVLGNLLDVNGFEYMSISEVSREVEEACKELKGDNSPKWSAVTSTDSKVDGLQRIISYPIYLTDAMSRRSSTLQQTAESKIADTVRVNQTTAANAGVSEAQQVQISKNGHSVIMPVMIDNGVPDGCIYLPVANAAVAGFGADIAGFKLQSV
jgi:NADH-quinone oxidoreductase subunit G